MIGEVPSPNWLVPVAALLVATVATTTANLIVAGLLPQLAADLVVDIPTAGFLITGYALGVAIAGPILALLTGKLPRKQLLIAMLAVFVLGNVLSAVSTAYWILLGARIVVACCHGLIFGLATVMATRLAPEGRQTSAVSLVVAGGTIATIAGLPLGTAIGNLYGWRSTFWVIAALGALAGAAVLLLIPAAGRQPNHKSSVTAEIRAAVRPVVLLWYAVFGFHMIGAFALYSYIVPLLTEVSGVPVDMVPWVLFGMGLAGFFGNLIGGRLGDWKPTATLVGILAGLIVTYLVMAQVTDTTWWMVVALWATWFIGFGFPAPLRARIIQHTSEAPTLASMLTTSAGNLGTAAGAAVGGLAIAAGWSYSGLPLISASCYAVALLGMLLLAALERRAAQAPAGA